MTRIAQLISDDEQGWSEVGKLFESLYHHMKEVEGSLLMPLSENGVQDWVQATRAVAGRFAILAIAYDDNQMVGFGFGSVRLAPDYLGGHKVGSINHFYVKPESRGEGTGKLLVEELERWFVAQQVHSVELEVTHNNTLGQSFWKAMNYLPELIQLRKLM